MIGVILAGGFGKRLLPISRYTPKVLLPIDGIQVIEFIVEKMRHIDLDEIIVATNAKFERQFRRWRRSIPKKLQGAIDIVVEPTRKEEEKLGSIGALRHLITIKDLYKKELLVVAGDNFFDFPITPLLVAFEKKKRKKSIVAFYEKTIPDSSRFGIGTFDNRKQFKGYERANLLSFVEKPTSSRVQCLSTGLYIYPAQIFKEMDRYLASQSSPDAAGRFVEWLTLKPKLQVQGVIFRPPYIWSDIGTLEDYCQLNEDLWGKLEEPFQ